MSTPNEETNAVPEPIFDPFPEPSGYPTGWDLSGITSEPAPATVPPTADEAEA